MPANRESSSPKKSSYFGSARVRLLIALTPISHKPSVRRSEAVGWARLARGRQRPGLSVS